LLNSTMSIYMTSGEAQSKTDTSMLGLFYLYTRSLLPRFTGQSPHALLAARYSQRTRNVCVYIYIASNFFQVKKKRTGVHARARNHTTAIKDAKIPNMPTLAYCMQSPCVHVCTEFKSHVSSSSYDERRRGAKSHFFFFTIYIYIYIYIVQ